MLRAAVWILPVKVDMGNCCGWCVRCCCHCCCSRCCRQAAAPEDHHEQLVADDPREEPVLTVTEDPTGDGETQELKVVVDLEVTELPGSKEGAGVMAEQTQTKTFAPAAQPLVRGGSGRGSWRLVPAARKEAGPRTVPLTTGTEAAEIAFDDAPQPAVHEPRNIVLFAHELEEGNEPTEVVQSFSFSATEGVLSDL